jgi:hypothetical protein
MSLTLTPDTREAPTAHALLASDLARRQLVSLPHLGMWAADDLVIPAAQDPPALEALPVVSDATAPIWPDRVRPTSYWYAPSFELLRPEPSDDPTSSPFLFSFRRAGTTGGGTSLGAGLDATVRFTLKPVMSDATTQAVAAAGNPNVTAVPLGNLSVTLAVPYRDQASGETRTQTFASSVEQRDGALVVTVELINDWVRLCYGALAYAGFQTQPAQLLVAYAYRAYTPVPAKPPVVLWGGKISALRIANEARDLPRRLDAPAFVAADRSIRLPSGKVQLEAERAEHTRTRGAPPRGTVVRDSPLVASHALVAAAPVSAAAVAATPVTAVNVHAAMALAPAIDAVIRRTEYAAQTLVRQATVDTSLPCASLGAFYRQGSEADDGTSTAVGCQDALRLGETALRLYEEIVDLATPRARVFRSLQQPGRFLLLPAAFRVTRYGASEPADRAFRPVILVYASLDAKPENSRYFFTATLQPDVRYYERRVLLERLRAFTPQGHEPMLDLPTAPSVQGTPTFRWAVPDVAAEPQVLAAWDSLQVSVSAGLTNALTLATIIQTSGLAGTVTFGFTDGSSLSSNLVIDTEIVGPWDGGPVDVAIAGTKATLTNRIEQAVSVTDVVVGATGKVVAVDATLAPRATTTVDLPANATSDVYPVYSVAPGHLTLQQLDIFSEDLTTQVLFVNLVNYANHSLSALQLQIRLSGTTEAHDMSIAENQTASVDVVFPLDKYLRTQAIEYQVTKVDTNGNVTTTAWISCDLAQSSVISITWDGIQ